MKKLISLVLASMAIGALVGCGQSSPTPTPGPAELPDEYSLLEHWEGNAGDAQEYYSVAKVGNNAEISYTGVSGFKYVYRTFAYDAKDIARFAGVYKKISFTGKLDVTSGSDIVLFKLEGGGMQAKEYWFQFQNTEKTYEISLENVITEWSTGIQLMFFANMTANKGDNQAAVGTGKMTFSKFCLSKADLVAANDIADDKQLPQPANPQAYNVYTGGDTFAVTEDYRSGDGTYTVEKVGNVWKATWAENKAQWDSTKALVKGDETHPLAAAGFKRLVMTLNGTEGIHVIAKVEAVGAAGAVEDNSIVLTGADQEVVLNVENVLKTEGATHFMVLFFIGFDQSIAGELTFKSVVFDKVEDVPPQPQGPDYNVYNGGDEFQVMTDWHYNGTDNAIAVVPADNIQNGYKLTWGGKGEWANVRALVKAGEGHPIKDSGLQRITFTLKGTAGRKVTVKLEAHSSSVNGGFAPTEVSNFELDGTDQTIQWDPRGTLNADYEEIWALIFPDPGTTGNVDVEGEIELKNVVIDKTEYVPPVPPAPEQEYNEYNGGDKLTVMTDWQDAVYSTTTASGDTWVINWEGQKDDAWANTKARVKDGTATIKTAGFKRVVFEVELATAGRHLFKIETHEQGSNDGKANVEHWADLEAGKNTIEFDVTNLLAGDYYEIWVLIFPDAGKTGVREAGQIQLIDCYFDKNDVTPVEEPKNLLNWGGAYLDYVNVGNIPGKSKGNHVQEITFENVGAVWNMNAGWSFEPTEDWFVNEENIGAYTHFTFKIKSTIDIECLFKPYDHDDYGRAIDLVANVEQEIAYDIPASICDASKNTFFFPHRGNATNKEALTGTITITDLQVTRPGVNIGTAGEVRLNKSVTPSGGAYTFSQNDNGDMVFAFDKAELGYDSFQVIANLDGEGYKHLTGTLTADQKVAMIIKNDNGGQEIRIVLEAGVAYTLDTILNNEVSPKWGKLIMMVGVPGDDVSALQATVTFANFKLSK